MALGVHLDEIRPEFPADLPDVVFLQGLSDAAVCAPLRRGVEVEMQAEIPAGGVIDGGILLSALAAGCQQQEREEESKSFHIRRCFYRAQSRSAKSIIQVQSMAEMP